MKSRKNSLYGESKILEAMRACALLRAWKEVFSGIKKSHVIYDEFSSRQRKE